MNSSINREVENQFLAAYDTYAAAIFRHCLFKISDRELAKDLTQEVFSRAWKYLAQGKQIENLKAFLYRVANNLVVDEYRKHKGISLDRLLEDGFDVATSEDKRLFDILDGRRAVEMLEKVDLKYRQVIKMRYLEGLLPKEIALMLNETENSVSVRINRGLKKAKKLLNSSEKK